MKKYILAIVLVGIIGSVSAQNYSSFTYSIGIPSGDLADYISKASFRGVTFEYHNRIQPNIGLGFLVGWNVFYEEKEYDTYTINDASLSGKQWRYSNHIPLLLSANYYLKPQETTNPFVGLGVGTIYSLRNTNMSQYTFQLEAWNFALQPEVGLLYSANPETTLKLSLKYFYGFQAGSELETPQSYFAVNVGFVFAKY